MVQKRYILRAILISIGVLAVIISVFLAEQYYRWNICNFRARDYQEHAYNIYEGASIDSVLNLLREDYDISSETDLKMHIRFLVFNTPEPGHYVFLVCEGRSSSAKGFTYKELASLMLEEGCSVAYNLDGGDSSQMAFLGDMVNDPSGRGRALSDIFYVTEP